MLFDLVTNTLHQRCTKVKLLASFLALMGCSLQNSFLIGVPIVLPSSLAFTGDIHSGMFSNQKLPGGGKRTRTADICRAKAALYQLSYTPNCTIV